MSNYVCKNVVFGDRYTVYDLAGLFVCIVFKMLFCC